MIETTFSRKLDSMGRLTIPIRLREEVGLIIGETYDFYKLVEKDGTTYLCIKCGDPLAEAKRKLAEAGYSIEPAAN